MALFVVRIWVPDRPGALGQVASRIGAVKADVVGIEILERGGGRVIDELIVEMSDPSLQQLLASEIGQVDGVDVELIREAGSADIDADLATLDRVHELVDAGPHGVVYALGRLVSECLAADWVAMAAPASGEVVWSINDCPPTEWIVAFVNGAGAASEGSPSGVAAADVALAPIGTSGLVVAAGRAEPLFRHRGRRRLAALARAAGAVLEAGGSAS